VASITIRNIEEGVKSRLRIQAAFHGRSMEDEAREILKSVLNRAPTPPGNLVLSIRNRFKRFGGVELPPVEREPMREPPTFGS
jgi:plasmid stability protein